MPDAPPPFQVDPALLRKYRVYVPGKKRPRDVVATYFRIEGGTLTFRIHHPGGGYPHMVATFATGMWAEIR